MSTVGRVSFSFADQRMNLKKNIRSAVEWSDFLYQLARTAQTGLNGIGRLYRTARRGGAIRGYLAGHRVAKLQIGAGPNSPPDWLNTDISASYSPRSVYMDATRPFPLADGTFDYVFSEHMIEHIPYAAGSFMLRECHRVLKPGGKIRIATPDLHRLLDLRSTVKSPIQQRYIVWCTDSFVPEVKVYHETFVINNAFRNWGHQFIYDEETLRNSLASAGFVDIVRYEPGESDDEHLRNIEEHGREIQDEELNRFETMVLQARRP